MFPTFFKQYKLYQFFLLLCFHFFAIAAENDSLQNVENFERLYKRDFINQIKNDLLKEKTSKDKPVDKQYLEKIDIIASNTYSSLSKQLLQLKKDIKSACPKQKSDKHNLPDELLITFTLIQIDTLITASCDHIEPPNTSYDKPIRKVFKDFPFSLLPIQSQEIQLKLYVSLSE